MAAVLRRATFFEGLVLALLGIGAMAMMMAGLATAPAAMSGMMMASSLPFVKAITGPALHVGSLFLVAGFSARTLARSRKAMLPSERTEPDAESLASSTSLLVLGATIVIVPAFLLPQLAPLVALCREGLAAMEGAGVWRDAMKNQEFSGIVLLPIAAVSLAPALELAAASMLAFGSACTVALLSLRSTRVPRVFVVCLLMQAALVASSMYMSDVVYDAARWLESEVRGERMAGMPTQERQQALAMLGRYESVVASAAGVLGWTLLGYALCLPLALCAQPERRRVARPTGAVADLHGASLGALAAEPATPPPVDIAELSGESRREFFAEAARKLQAGAFGGKARQVHVSRTFAIALLGATFALFAATRLLLQLAALRPGG